MRISDWSSDVCSSDLAEARALLAKAEADADDLMTRRAAMAEDKIAAAERQAVADVRAHAAEAATDAAGAIIAQQHGARPDKTPIDRKSVGWGKRVSVRVEIGGRSSLTKKQQKKIQ